MPPHLEKSTNHAYLENVSYEQTVTHLETELELNRLEALDELQMNSVTQKQQTEGNKVNAGNINGEVNNSNPNNIKNDRTSKIVSLPRGTCENIIISQRNVTREPMRQTGNFCGRPNL